MSAFVLSEALGHALACYRDKDAAGVAEALADAITVAKSLEDRITALERGQAFRDELRNQGI